MVGEMLPRVSYLTRIDVFTTASTILVFLTLIVYATSIFVDSGSFLFPYPLNEGIFAVIIIQYCYWELPSRRPG